MPHAMIVDRPGRRFCNDSYWVDLVPKALEPGRSAPAVLPRLSTSSTTASTAWATPHRAVTTPTGLVTSAPTLRELGAALGIDGEQLEATAATFSQHAARGEDPEFGRGTVEFINRFSGDPSHRPSPVLGPITEAPFHGLRLLFAGHRLSAPAACASTGTGTSSTRRGAVISGLYAVGSCAATTTFGSGYNSGMALSRGLTLAYLVAEEIGTPAA